MKTLKKGQTGSSIVTLKKRLYDLGYRDFSTSPTGLATSNRYSPFFSANTAAAVRRFQRNAHLPTDGEVGPKTWAALAVAKPDAPVAKSATDISERGLDRIARYEAFRAHAYKPVASEQYYTIGYGHYGPDVHPGQTISESAARVLLRKDVARFVKTVRDAVKVPVNQHRFDAMVSLCYNIGEGNFRTSSVVKRLNAGDYKGASRAFLMWVNGASGFMQGLLTRRRDERKLFDTPVDSK